MQLVGGEDAVNNITIAFVTFIASKTLQNFFHPSQQEYYQLL